MNFILHNLISIGERTRELDLSHKNEIKKDILRNGLLQPIVLGDSADTPLIDGLHRLHALIELHAAGEIITFDTAPLEPFTIPFVRFSELEPARLLEAEIAANIFRRELTWPERNRALARLHAMQLKENPNATVIDTAAKLAGVSGKPIGSIRNAISRAVVIAEALEATPELATSRSETEAFSRIKTDLTRIAAGLLDDGVTSTHSIHTLIEGDFTTILPAYEGPRFDLILTDPPYGVGADGWTSKFVDAPHVYKDTWAHAASLYASLFTHGLNVLNERGNIFAFCAVERWHLLRDMAESLGWSVWPRPVIWHKSNEGIRPWGQRGYAYCYEAFLFACKGQKGLIKTGADVITGIYKVRDREHGAAKPATLFTNLIQSACLPGDRVLDPCCGGGTIFEAATISATIATGIELDPHYVGLSRERLELTREMLDLEELESF